MDPFVCIDGFRLLSYSVVMSDLSFSTLATANTEEAALINYICQVVFGRLASQKKSKVS